MESELDRPSPPDEIVRSDEIADMTGVGSSAYAAQVPRVLKFVYVPPS